MYWFYFCFILLLYLFLFLPLLYLFYFEKESKSGQYSEILHILKACYCVKQRNEYGTGQPNQLIGNPLAYPLLSFDGWTEWTELFPSSIKLTATI
jgi:hypothetical protein